MKVVCHFCQIVDIVSGIKVVGGENTGCLLAFVFFFEPLSTDYNTCSMMAGLDLFYSKHLSFWDFRIKSTEISSKWQNFVL